MALLRMKGWSSQIKKKKKILSPSQSRYFSRLLNELPNPTNFKIYN